MPDLFLELPLPPSLNTLYPTVGNRRVLSKAGKDWYAKAVYAIRKQTGLYISPPFKIDRVKLTIWFTFPDKRRCDISNYIKATEDCLTKCGAWTDDSQVDQLEVYRMKPDKSHSGAKVMISVI